MNAPFGATNMKVVILAGGFGTRIGEESAVRAKPRSRLQPMDSLRDKIALEQQWASGESPWRVR